MCQIYVFGQLQQPEGFTQIEMKQRFSFLYKICLIMPSLYLSSCVLWEENSWVSSISPRCLNGVLPELPFDASRLIVLLLLCVCVCVSLPRASVTAAIQRMMDSTSFSDTFHSAAHKGASWGLRYVPSEGDRSLRHGCLVSSSLLLLDVRNSPADGLVF